MYVKYDWVGDTLHYKPREFPNTEHPPSPLQELFHPIYLEEKILWAHGMPTFMPYSQASDPSDHCTFWLNYTTCTTVCTLFLQMVILRTTEALKVRII